MKFHSDTDRLLVEQMDPTDVPDDHDCEPYPHCISLPGSLVRCGGLVWIAQQPFTTHGRQDRAGTEDQSAGMSEWGA